MNSETVREFLVKNVMNLYSIFMFDMNIFRMYLFSISY